MIVLASLLELSIASNEILFDRKYWYNTDCWQMSVIVVA